MPVSIAACRPKSMPHPAVVGGMSTWTPTANPAWQGNGSNSGNTTLTFTGLNLGSPSASDVIVIGVVTVAVGSITSVTVNGSAATQQVATALAFSRQLAIYSITGLTAATGNVAVSTAANLLGDAVVFVGKLTGVNATPGTADHKDMQSVTGPSTLSVTAIVPTNGFGIYLGMDIATETFTISNATVDYSATNGSANGGVAKFGNNSTAGSQTVSSQGTGGGYVLGAALVPWGP